MSRPPRIQGLQGGKSIGPADVLLRQRPVFLSRISTPAAPGKWSGRGPWRVFAGFRSDGISANRAGTRVRYLRRFSLAGWLPRD